MAVKVMMIQERLSKIIVPTSKTFSLNQLELEKTSDKEIMTFAMLYLQSRCFCNYQLDGAIKYFWYTIIH